MLVSDGVTDVLPLEDVSQHVMRHTDAAAACKARSVDDSNARVTVVRINVFPICIP